MLTSSILVAEPDAETRAVLVDGLQRAGYPVATCHTIDGTLSAIRQRPPSLLILDCGDDPARVLDLLRHVKERERYAAVRVLLTSRRQANGIGEEALRSGADDFLAKPYSIGELLARVTLALKRQPVRGTDSALTQVGRIAIDDASHRVTVDDQIIDLAPREFQLLRFFATNVDRLYSRQQLLSFVWQQADGLGERTVDVHVRRLRRLLEPFGCEHYVETVRGVGYRFSPDLLAHRADVGGARPPAP